MKQQILKTGLLVALFLLLIAACQAGDSQAGVLETYEAYYAACETGDFEAAKNFLSEDAQEKATVLGVCAFTHDAINEYAASQGQALRTFSEAPEVEENETSAAIGWYDDQGNIASVFLHKTEDGWKIIDAIWSN